MNDTVASSQSSPETSSAAPLSPAQAPQFGALDIVEAFTAMRHEWRGQTKESRALAEQIKAAVETLQALDVNLRSRASSGEQESGQSKPLALTIVETDQQLSRAIAAVAQWEQSRRQREAEQATAVDQYFARMSAVSRWFARPLWTFISQQRDDRSLSAEPMMEGLHLVQARLRRAMSEHQIERVDTLGQAFDANTMRAIGSVSSSEQPAGHVVEQLTPAYRWQGHILRFADVRVAQ